MASVLRLNNTDQRIKYDDAWAIVPNDGVGPNGIYDVYSSRYGAKFSLLFRGIVLHT